jgi:iron complex outermembrane receptor protein
MPAHRKAMTGGSGRWKKNMLMKTRLLLAGLIISGIVQAQSDSLPVGLEGTFHDQALLPVQDTLERRSLQEVVVRAYEQNRRLADVPAAVGVLTPAQFNRFGNSSIVSAFNTIPGVRMEERSPGSYRLSFRGSTLRSPFGVRNVKVYLNGIPFTDPGGNSYLTQLAPFDIQSLEVIKGPAGSLYGAGTGGALLIETQPDDRPAGFTAGYTFGSFNTHTVNARVRLGDPGSSNSISYSHQSSGGYRDHTQLRRDMAIWESVISNSGKQSLRSLVSYGDLYYQTPGALTLAEYRANPKQARPAAGPNPSADQSRAAIYQKTFMAALTEVYHFNAHWQNSTNIYGAYTNYRNPTFRNYEIRNEPHFGGRTLFTLHAGGFQLDAGAEAQKGFFKTEDFGNRNGSPDTVQTNDNIDTWTWSVFAQGDLRFGRGWQVTAGMSYNQSFIGIDRLSVPGFIPRNKTFSNQLAPRLALSKKLSAELLLYASVSKGFSPPSVAEVLPSNQSINTGLRPEQGVNYEAGLKADLLDRRLYAEVVGFYFRVQQAIVVRKDSAGSDYYINAGGTKQQGIEAQLSYQLLPSPGPALSSARCWLAYTLNRFTYDHFQKDDADYSGKQLPGVAHNTVAGGLDLLSTPGLFLHLTYYYSDKLPLDDTNSAYADAYQLLSGKIGYESAFRKIRFSVFAGIDNALNSRYSLGNDINAAGGRYYNAAPGVSYYVGLTISGNKAGTRSGK